MKKWVAVILFAALWSVSSCGYQKQEAFRMTKKIRPVKVAAVLPFENLSQMRSAGDMVSKMFYDTAKKRLDIKFLDHGRMMQRLREKQEMLPKLVDRLAAWRIGRVLNADVVFYGSVHEYAFLKEARDDGRVITNEPVVGIAAYMLDVRTGEVVWASVHSRSTYDLMLSDRESISRIATRAIENMTDQLFVELNRANK